jgi:hypothetical protein
MILETGQMLSTAYRKNFDDGEELYKTAYPHHPMTIWVGSSGTNFYWSIQLLDQLLYQYTMRYKKVHKTMRISSLFHSKYKLWHNWETEFTPPPLCMPDEYKCDNYIQSYKDYYVGEKKRFAKYTSVDTPDFMC